jgi:hypothetical protein|tara:strand:- start:357 stop:1064 length:708 start_codon:yes stop_codon:yes gene_type:complete
MFYRYCTASAACSVTTALIVAVVCVMPLGAGQVDEQHEVLLGTWVLNDDLSDALPPRTEMSKGNRGRRGGGFSGPGGGFGGPGGGGLGGRRGGFGGRTGGRVPPEDRALRRAGLQEAIKDLTTAPRRMTIGGTPEEIVLTYNDRRVIRLLPDGREHAGLAGTSMRVTRVTQWDDATLVAEIQLDSEVKFEIEQKYRVHDGEDGLQLVVTSRFNGGPFGRETREIRRVYDGENSPN